MTDAEPRFAPNPASGRDPRPLCIDLFSGEWGFSEGFIGLYTVLGIDKEMPSFIPDGAIFWKGDVLDWSETMIDELAPLVILAGIPCEGFSLANRGRWDGSRPTDAELILARHAFRLARRSHWWIVENVRGAIRYFGPPDFRWGSRYFWGRIPPFMLERANAPMKYGGSRWNRPEEGKVQHRAARETARIQYLSRSIAEACLP